MPHVLISHAVGDGSTCPLGTILCRADYGEEVCVDAGDLYDILAHLLAKARLVFPLEQLFIQFKHRAPPCLVFRASTEQHDVRRALVQPGADRLRALRVQELLNFSEVGEIRFLDAFGRP